MIYLGAIRASAVRKRFHIVGCLLAGERTAPGIARQTGLSAGMVRAVLNWLVRSGYATKQRQSRTGARNDEYHLTRMGCDYIQRELERWFRDRLEDQELVEMVSIGLLG